jgi:exodeoxyribonuclease VII small subunit
VAKKPIAQKNYQQLAEELAGIIDWFESDDVNLDQALIKYEKATKLLAQMEAYLKTAQNSITKITTKAKG